MVRGGSPTPAADVYALACVLFEALTGVVPFPAVEDAAKLFAHINGTPEPVSSVRPELAPIDDVVGRGMAKDPKDRYPAAGEFAAATASALAPSRAPRADDLTRSSAAPETAPPTDPVETRRHSSRVDLTQHAAAPPTRRGDAVPPATSDDAVPPLAEGKQQTAPARRPATVARARASSATARSSRRVALLVLGLVLVGALAVAAFLLIDGGGSSDVTAIDLNGQPAGVAAGGGAVWVATDPGSIAQLGLGSGDEPGEPIDVRGTPLQLATDAKHVWVGTLDNLVRVDPAGGPAQKNALDITPQGMAVGHGAVWIASGGNTVIRVDTGSGAQRPITVGGSPKDVAVGDRAVWVVNSDDGEVVRIDPEANKTVGRPIRVETRADAIASGAGGVWVTNEDQRTITPVSPLGKSISLPAGPTDVAASNGSVWVVAGRALYRFAPDLKTRTRIDLPAEGRHVAVGRGAVWVTSTDERVFRVDL